MTSNLIHRKIGTFSIKIPYRDSGCQLEIETHLLRGCVHSCFAFRNLKNERKWFNDGACQHDVKSMTLSFLCCWLFVLHSRVSCDIHPAEDSARKVAWCYLHAWGYEWNVGTHMVKGEKLLLQVVLWLSVHANHNRHAHLLPYTHTHEHLHTCIHIW